jgi:DNA-binding protein H-NS
MRGNFDHLKSMSADELWLLWEEVSSVLARKIVEEKAKLEERLRLLEKSSRAIGPNNNNRPRGA